MVFIFNYCMRNEWSAQYSIKVVIIISNFLQTVDCRSVRRSIQRTNDRTIFIDWYDTIYTYSSALTAYSTYVLLLLLLLFSPYRISSSIFNLCVLRRPPTPNNTRCLNPRPPRSLVITAHVWHNEPLCKTIFFANEVENFHARTSLLKVIKPLQFSFVICRTIGNTGCQLHTTEDHTDR